ncbi:MAG: hypothetical protein IPG50_07650 [Myxococcales bacterium]|nr:hypothetical protein [Myxococcales bacterium]
MKIASGIVRFHVWQALLFGAPVVGPVVLAGTFGAALTACADENDPATWAKRLEDPAQRSTAAKRMAQFFQDSLTKNNNNREAPEVKKVLDAVVEPLTKVYVAGGLDEKTRKDLMKGLADMGDPRASAAFAKAFTDYEPGKNDEDVKFSAQAVQRMVSGKKTPDQTLVDALWTCFSKFQMSKAKSINLVTDLHDAILEVKSPSYGPKAVEKLAAPVQDSVDSQKDQIHFWQKISIRVIKELKFAPAAKPLVKVLLDPRKAELRGTVQAALMVMPKEAEDALLAALKGTDAELAKLTAEVPDKVGVAILADTLSWISRSAGKDALLAALDQADSDTNRVVIAQSLTRFPPDQRTKDALLKTYTKIPAGTRLKTPGDPLARPVLVQVAAAFYDPAMTEWALKEVAASKGDEGASMIAFGLEAAVKLMTKDQLTKVGEVVSKSWSAKEQEIYKAAATIVTACDKDAACYVKKLGEPIASGDGVGMWRAVKAARMAAMFGKDDTKQALLASVDKVKEAGARLAVVEAIDYLCPKGDAQAAAALDKIVAADVASGNKNLIAGDDAVVKVANRLRARAL